jgi:hypothetical protein
MGWCTFFLVICVIFGLAGWATAYIWLARARRYREAFERAFALARRVYTVSDSEKAQFARIIGRPIENDPNVS